MSGSALSDQDHRNLSRDSMFLMADLRMAGWDDDQRIKVRNLSAGGMMAEGVIHAIRGTLVQINLRNIGWIEGAVAWVQDNRCGIAFAEDVDPQLARAANVAGADETTVFLKPVIVANPVRGDGKIRKI